MAFFHRNDSKSLQPPYKLFPSRLVYYFAPPRSPRVPSLLLPLPITTSLCPPAYAHLSLTYTHALTMQPEAMLVAGVILGKETADRGPDGRCVTAVEAVGIAARELGVPLPTTGPASGATTTRGEATPEAEAPRTAT